MAGRTPDRTGGGAGPAIDHAHLAAQTGGDTDLARELLTLFAGQCRALVPGIVDTGLSAAERADKAHTLKGSAAGIGAFLIRSLCDGIEDGLRRSGSAEAAALAELRSASDDALAEIARSS